jgi:primosomal protein N' (replication factor Y) (superfamily II helicase)
MIVGVHPLAGFDKLLHYRVPAPLAAAVTVGSLVRVPILRQHRLGVVGVIGAPADFPVERLKAILEVVHPFPALPPDLLELARWMSAYYAAGLDTVIEAMLPAAVRGGTAPREEKLLAAGERLSPADAVALARRAPRQAQLYAFLRQQFKPQPKALVLRRLGLTAAAAAALVKRGLAREETRRVAREGYADDWAHGEVVAAIPPTLNEEQTAAVAAVRASLDRRAYATHLLHGVTGSGKTEVYLAAVAAALAAGGGVIYLVPEVALTPQTVARLHGRLQAIAPDHQVVVWHSHLGEGERFDGWVALATGAARVVVGARSAVFAPVRDLRLIVVDEEHEPAYKQDETPRYHGRDVAVYRARLSRAVCLLGSATPSIESIANARSGKYRLATLTRRVDHRELPAIEIVDMRIEVLRTRGSTTLSRRLVEQLRDRFERREQVMLFINRRGYSSSLLCTECGHVETCPHCSIAMTYHRTDETLRCHLCGHQRPAPYACPQCHSPKIRWRGLGTQKVEEAVRRVLPRARIERMDSDTMAKKNRFRQVLTDFRLGRIDVLVGTQMIGKGLDFPNVTLVGLVDADLSLHVPDFRANERTFQLLVQVAGRSGRGERAGEVVVQTFTPHADAIQFARRTDFDGFVEVELKMRAKYRYPPVRHLIHHLFRGPNPDKLKFVAETWVRQARARLGEMAEVSGPAPSPIEKIKDEYRYQVWYFTTNVTRVVPVLAQLRAEFVWPDGVTQVLDVDPMNMA